MKGYEDENDAVRAQVGVVRRGQFRLHAARFHSPSHLFQYHRRKRRRERFRLRRLLVVCHQHRHRGGGGIGAHLRLAVRPARHAAEDLLRRRARRGAGVRGARLYAALDVVPRAVRVRQICLPAQPGGVRFHAVRRHHPRAHGRSLFPRLCLGVYRQLHPLRAHHRRVCAVLHVRAHLAAGVHDHRLPHRGGVVGRLHAAPVARLRAAAVRGARRPSRARGYALARAHLPGDRPR